MRGPVIVTRPAPAGERLTHRLRAAGWNVLHWPAFHLLPARDPERVRTRLLQAAPGELLVFVSPAAVRACAAILPSWPAGLRAAAVGAGSARAFHDAYGEAVDCLSPEDAAGEGGSEALFSRLASEPWPQRVLILRAEQGREWLAEQLQAAGVTVEALCVYRREPLDLDSIARDELVRTMALGRPPVLLVMAPMPDGPSRATEWLQHPAVAGHPRRMVPSALTVCGGPWTARAVRALAR